MITGELRNKIDKLWNDIYSYGLTNPLKVIEQLTYLFFIKSLDDKEIENERNRNVPGEKLSRVFNQHTQQCRWSNFIYLEPKEMHKTIIEKVFPFIRKMSNNGGYVRFLKDIVYEIPTPIITDMVIKRIDKLPLKDRDLKGDIYEYMLGKLQTAGQLGQFRTPRQIIKMMVELVQPKIGDTICDPALGTGGFLSNAAEYIKENEEDKLVKSYISRKKFRTMFYGYDTDQSMLRIAAMNLIMHDISTNNIAYRNSLSDDNKDEIRYSLVLANPPFKGAIAKESISAGLKYICDTTKTELLFVSLFIKSLALGGRCACIVPEGVLFRSNKAYKQLRLEIIENQKLQAIISMPSGVFKPYAGVSTAIMIFTKTGVGGTDKVWFYDMQADGFSLNDKRSPIDANDIPDIIGRFHNIEEEKHRTRFDKSFLVPKAEIVEKGYDLSINKYKQTQYEKEEYANPIDTIKKLKTIENEIIDGLYELENMLKEKA